MVSFHLKPEFVLTDSATFKRTFLFLFISMSWRAVFLREMSLGNLINFQLTEITNYKV